MQPMQNPLSEKVMGGACAVWVIGQRRELMFSVYESDDMFIICGEGTLQRGRV